MSYGFWSLKLCDMVEKIHVCLVDFDVFGRDQWEICVIDRICALGLGDIIKFCCLVAEKVWENILIGILSALFFGVLSLLGHGIEY